MSIILGLDLETTGLEQSKGHRIIEVACLLYDADSENLLGKYVQRINPQRSIDPGAQAVHGISFDMVSACPTWEEVAPKVVKIMQKSNLIVAHNGIGFDLPFTAGELLRIGLPIPDVKVFDTMVDGRWATAMGKLPNLRELCFACGIEYDTEKAHAAEYDVHVMMASYFHGRRKGAFKYEQQLKEAA